MKVLPFYLALYLGLLTGLGTRLLPCWYKLLQGINSVLSVFNSPTQLINCVGESIVTTMVAIYRHKIVLSMGTSQYSLRTYVGLLPCNDKLPRANLVTAHTNQPNPWQTIISLCLTITIRFLGNCCLPMHLKPAKLILQTASNPLQAFQMT